MSNQYLNIALLFASVVLQIQAALLALQAMPGSGKYRYSWLALSLALTLMVERRAVPLYEAVQGGHLDFVNTLFGFLISLLMALSLLGLRSLLKSLRDNEERLTRLATIDVLTGLANRCHVLASLEMELRRAERNGRPLSLLMLDLDHFKAINDQYGHAIGDAVLVAAAARWTSCLRAVDMCGRIGGEEFLVVLPDTDADAARTTAERLRAVLADSPIDTASGELNVTVSIGAASQVVVSKAEASASEDRISSRMKSLQHRVDQALYRAKADGRNCVRDD